MIKYLQNFLNNSPINQPWVLGALSFILLLSSPTHATPISLYKSFEGNIAIATAGNSELTETGETKNCGNGKETSDQISIPAGASVKAAYLYWYAMTQNNTAGDDYPFKEIQNTAPVTFPSSTATIQSTRQFKVTKAGWGGKGTWQYSGRFADVTTQVSNKPNGTYTVDVQGGASNAACANSEENARAWKLVVVYEDKTTIQDNKKIYIFDGLIGYLDESIITPVTGFKVPATSTKGSLTVTSIQGDKGISGEYMSTSDTSFPDFPEDFANGDHGAALDIDTLQGDFTPGATSMEIHSGTKQDLIFTAGITLTIPTVPTVKPPEAITSLTLVANITNDDNGTATVNDLGITTSAGSPQFDNGEDNAPTVYTSDPMTVTAGSYDLSAVRLTGYTDTNWSCITSTNTELVLNTGFSETSIESSIMIAEGTQATCTVNYDDSAGKSNECTALTGILNAGLSPVSNLKSQDKIFLGSTEISSQIGHLKAYKVNANGAPSTTVEWDAATKMNVAKRTAAFYTTNTSNTKTLLSQLPPADLGVADITAANTLRATIYNASLGSLSPSSNLALITSDLDTLSYLNDADYRTYYTNTISTRTPRILASSDDGFLYAFNQSNGELGWSWMPKSLVTEIKKSYSTTFKEQHYMQGSIDVLELKDATSSYHTYVVGSYKQGLGQYILRLTDNSASDLDAVIWEEDLSNTKATAPHQGKRTYFKDGSGIPYFVTIASGVAANSSTLYIKTLTDANAPITIDLPFTATASPHIGSSIDSQNKMLYLGDDAGNIYAAELLQTNGNLKSSSDILTLLGSAITAIDTVSPSSAVQFIGGAQSSKNNGYYLRAQSDDRLTLFKYKSSSSSWVRQWTSYTGGSNKWVNGSTTASTDTHIPDLPSDALITDSTYIIADSLVLPVMHAPVGTSCAGDSYYYFYKLADGHFPTNTFYNNTTALTDKLEVGIGRTRTLHLVNLLGSDKLLGLGMADQKVVNGTTSAGIGASFLINDPFTTGIRSKRELRK